MPMQHTSRVTFTGVLCGMKDLTEPVEVTDEDDGFFDNAFKKEEGCIGV